MSENNSDEVMVIKNGLYSIIENLKNRTALLGDNDGDNKSNRHKKKRTTYQWPHGDEENSDYNTPNAHGQQTTIFLGPDVSIHYSRRSTGEEQHMPCETTVTTDSIDITPQIQATLKSSRKRRMDRAILANSTTNLLDYPIINNNVNNNNNHVKNERLSPSTPDTSSRSRSVTPSSASHPDTPPANETPLLPGVRNCSDFMRSLAAKYNNPNTNDYFNAVKNGFSPSMDPRFKPTSFSVMSNVPTPTNNKEIDLNNRKPGYSPVISPIVNNQLFTPLIDMSSSQTLLYMARAAKEAEVQDIIKNIKRPEPSSPLDLSAAAQLTKKVKVKHSNASSSSNGLILPKRVKSESPHSKDDIKNWTVDDVCNFVSSIDICAEYSQNFRDQSIDGSGLPLLTEEHLTTTMNMKLGPALKLKSILAKKFGSCNICLHCTHCHHNAASPEPANNTGFSSDSGGITS